MSKLLIVGDIHLGKGLNLGKSKNKQLNSKILDQFQLLDWIIEQAFERNVDRIIITGDIFEDVRPSSILLEGFLDFLIVLEEHKICVDIVLGNHDLQRTGQFLRSSLDLINQYSFSCITLHKSITTIELDNAYLTLLPFRDKRFYNTEAISEALEKVETEIYFETLQFYYDFPAILIGHLALSGSIPVGDEFDDSLNEIICPLEFFSAYKYVWMGHVHKPQILKSDNRQHIAHIGNLDLCNIDEIDQKKILIYLNTTDINNFETIEVPVRPLFNFKIEILNLIGDVTNIVIDKLLELSKDNNLSKSIIKLEISISEHSFFDKSQIKTWLYEQNVFNVVHILENKIYDNVIQTNVGSVDNLFEPKEAIKVLANTLLLPEDIDISEFLQEANSIIECFEENNAK